MTITDNRVLGFEYTEDELDILRALATSLGVSLSKAAKMAIENVTRTRHFHVMVAAPDRRQFLSIAARTNTSLEELLLKSATRMLESGGAEGAGSEAVPQQLPTPPRPVDPEAQQVAECTVWLNPPKAEAS